MNKLVQSAHDIASEVLMETGNAMMNGDFDLFASRFHLPQTMDTFSGRTEIKTRDDLRAIFMSVRNQYDLLGVTENVRRVISAEFRDPETISATHESRLMRGALSVREPYPAHSILKKIRGRWMITSSSYAVADHNNLADRPTFSSIPQKDDAD